MDEARFDLFADKTLQTILAALDTLDIEAELELGVLKISFEDGPDYVVNSHRAARQIWMAAVATAWHFDPGPDGWIAAKTGDELRATVKRLLRERARVDIAL